jgi:tetratricopeptide (TPR) repeat protein
MVIRVATLSLAICLCWMPTPAVHAAEKAAVHNRQVADLLGEAQKLSSRKQWSGALAAIKKAQAVPEQSAYSEYKISEFLGYLLTQQKKYAEAAPVFEQLADSKQASTADRSSHLKTAAQLYYQAQQYPRAAAVARRALSQQPGDVELQETLSQAEYLGGDYKSAAVTLQQLVAGAEKHGAKPKESWLQMLLSSYDRLQDRAHANGVWEMLLRHYPKPDYWQAVLSERTAGRQPPAIELGYQRLMFDLGMLKKPGDFENLSLGAIDAGAPGEAVQVLEAGLQQKILTGPTEPRFRRMLDYAKQAAAKQYAQLADLTRNAEHASTGQLSIALGRLHLGEGHFDQAAAALSQGLKKGNLNNPEQGRIDLGIALLKNRQPDAARKTFDAVDEKSEWHPLAQLWSLRTT